MANIIRVDNPPMAIIDDAEAAYGRRLAEAYRILSRAGVSEFGGAVDGVLLQCAHDEYARFIRDACRVTGDILTQASCMNDGTRPLPSAAKDAVKVRLAACLIADGGKLSEADADLAYRAWKQVNALDADWDALRKTMDEADKHACLDAGRLFADEDVPLHAPLESAASK